MNHNIDICQPCLLHKWITIRLVCPNNTPYSGIPYTLKGGSETRTGVTSTYGIIHETKLIDQSYDLILPVWAMVERKRQKALKDQFPVAEWLDQQSESGTDWHYQIKPYDDSTKEALLADIKDGFDDKKQVDDSPKFISKTADDYFGHLNTQIPALSVLEHHCIEMESLLAQVPALTFQKEYHYVNAYNLALATSWIYSDWGENENDQKVGSLQQVLTLMAKNEPHNALNTANTRFVTQEVPFASRMLFPRLIVDKKAGAEALVACQGNKLLIFVRGTEGTEWDQDEIKPIWSEDVREDRLISSGAGVIFRYLAYQNQSEQINRTLDIIIKSNSYKDIVLSDINAEQVPFAPSQDWLDRQLDDWVPVLDSDAPRVHKGFATFAGALWKLIEPYIAIHRNRIRRYLLAGHSLGGAGATLLAAYLVEKKITHSPLLYTYGSPRVGTHSFVEKYKAIEHHRHVNNRDGVPMVPFRWMDAKLSDVLNAAERQRLLVSASLVSIPIVTTFGALGALVIGTAANTTIQAYQMTDFDDDNYTHHGNLRQILSFGENHFVATPQSIALTHSGLASIANYLSTELAEKELMETVVGNNIDDLKFDGDQIEKEAYPLLIDLFSSHPSQEVNGKSTFTTIDSATIKLLNLDTKQEFLKSGADHSVATGYAPKLATILKNALTPEASLRQQAIKNAMNELNKGQSALEMIINKIQTELSNRLQAIDYHLKYGRIADPWQRDELHRSKYTLEQDAKREIEYYQQRLPEIEHDLQIMGKMSAVQIDSKQLNIQGLTNADILKQIN
ncbi:lipase family protein [Motilimonas sp. KMU-193]|uniref:lipase family protein n=1 Tax=Motilimonas sp. KMU-193 TaxID=3388668 RepID=UPI00396AFAD6